MKKILLQALCAVFIVPLFIAFSHPTQVSAQTAPEGFQVRTIVGGLTYPTSMAFTQDGRIFVAEKSGVVRLIRDGKLQRTPVITLPDVNTFLDRGLIGIAVDPNFSSNGFLYLSYTHENSPENYEGPKVGRIIRVTVEGDTADLSTAMTLVGSVSGNSNKPSCSDFSITDDCMFSSSPSHSVGGLRFSPDGKLYASLGDGAHFAYADPEALYALDVDALAGKILRINTDGTAPSDNPFYDGDSNSNRSKVWSYGLRNPYRFNFRPYDNELFLADVGWGEAEEVNIHARGANFGWPCREGYGATSYDCETKNYTDPIYTYAHNEEGIGSITGGSFPMDSAYPDEYMSSYYFGDYSQGFIKQMKLDQNNNILYVDDFVTSAGGPVDILTGPDGTIYYVDIYHGEIRNIVFSTENRAPVARIGASPTAGEVPLTVHFTGKESFDPDGDALSFFWEFGDGSAPSAEMDPAHTYVENGSFPVVLTVRDSDGNTGVATAVINVGEGAPAEAKPSHDDTTISPAIPNIGSEIIITSSVRNDGANDPFIVDMEVYDSMNEKIGQKVFEDALIESGQTKEYSYAWFPPSPGTYRAAVGLFKPNWSGLYEWTNEAYEIEVHNRVPGEGEFRPGLASVTVSADKIRVGDSSTITASVHNAGGSGSMLVDIEIYKNGVKVAQKFFDNEQFRAGETKNYSFDWTASEVGSYSVSVGLFKVNWSSLYSWLSDVASIEVDSGDMGGDRSSIYDDELSEGWSNWSWDTDVDFTSTVKYAGSHAVMVKYMSPWAGLYLHNDSFVTYGKNSISFAISGGESGGQKLKVFLYDSNGKVISDRSLSDYIGKDALSPNEWVRVSIPLSTLGGNDRVITGFAIQGSDGRIQQTYYVDEVRVD